MPVDWGTIKPLFVLRADWREQLRSLFVFEERPLLIVVRRPGATLDKATVLEYLAGRIAKWWLPDDVVFVDELPHTATGKLLKTKLREQYRDYKLPTA